MILKARYLGQDTICPPEVFQAQESGPCTSPALVANSFIWRYPRAGQLKRCNLLCSLLLKQAQGLPGLLGGYGCVEGPIILFGSLSGWLWVTCFVWLYHVACRTLVSPTRVICAHEGFKTREVPRRLQVSKLMMIRPQLPKFSVFIKRAEWTNEYKKSSACV